MNKPSTFDANKMAEVVARAGKSYVKELRFRNRFKYPDKKMSHSYDVIFEVPWHERENSRIMVNRIMVDIEDALEKEANVSYRGCRNKGCGGHRREWMD
jgi:hypothetical protein